MAGILALLLTRCFFTTQGFPGGSDGEESACNAGDPGSIPGSRRCSGEGNGNPLQYSCLENSMDIYVYILVYSYVYIPVIKFNF